MIRHAMASHIFHEPRPGYVEHTAASRAFVTEGTKEVIGFITEDAFPCANAQIAALEKWGHGSPEANESGFSNAFDTKLSVFEFYKQDPVRGARFAKCMHYQTKGDSLSIKNVVRGFDWAALGPVTVVDIAGSLGHCSVAIVEAAPQIKCIVQDLPNVVAVAQDPKTCIVSPQLRDRVSFMAHDFFKPQPIKAECYFLRNTLHIYSDKYVIKILQALAPALQPGTRVLIMDQVMPPMGTVPSPGERKMRVMDLTMMLTNNSKERTLEEWEAIFKTGDARLKTKNVTTPPGSVLSIIELIVQ
jgi:hypothetical protein